MSEDPGRPRKTDLSFRVHLLPRSNRPYRGKTLPRSLCFESWRSNNGYGISGSRSHESVRGHYINSSANPVPTQRSSFSAEKSHNKKGVIEMKYTKPEITRIAEATTAICLDNSLAKSILGFDLTNPHRMTPVAYSADEE